MNNGFQNLFQSIKDSDVTGFTKEVKYSKNLKDEFIVLRLKPSNQEYDISIMVWKKVFTTCGVFQISGRIGNQSFRVFFIIDKNRNIELFNFSKKGELCEILYDKNHRFLEILDNNLDLRKKIYRDTKQLRNKFKQNFLNKNYE
jgi:hypothetical protein